MSYLKKLRKRRREKEDTPVYNQKDNQDEIQNMEEDHIPNSVEKIPGTNKIEEFAMFVADKYYNGCYTIEKYTGSQYRFGFGIVESGDISGRYVGKTINEAMYRAIIFELMIELKSMGEYDSTQREDLTKLANERLAIIQDERQKSKELKDKLHVKEREYKDLVSLADNRLAIIQEERQKYKEMESKIIAKEKEYEELTTKYEDSEAFISEQAGVIEESKQEIKELQDDIASKESENILLTQKGRENEGYIKVQSETIERLQKKVNMKEDENAVLTKESKEYKAHIKTQDEIIEKHELEKGKIAEAEKPVEKLEEGGIEEVPKIEGEKEYKPIGKVFETFITEKIRNEMFEGELKRLDFHFHNNPIRDASQMLNEGTPVLNEVQIQKCIRDVFKNFEELEDAPIMMVKAYILYFEINKLIEKTEKEGNVTYTVKRDMTIPKLKKKKKPKPKKGIKLERDEDGPSAEDILGMEG